MIYKNTRHTALEVLLELGESSFRIDKTDFKVDEVIGKVRVRMGGLRPASNDALVKIADVSELEVMVGNVVHTIPVADSVEGKAVVTEDALRVIGERGKKANENVERLRLMKETMVAMEKGKEPVVGATEEIIAEASRQLEYKKKRELEEKESKK